MDKKWINLKPNIYKSKELSEGLGIDFAVASTIYNRGIETIEEAKKYLFPSLENLYDPFLLPDMNTAVDRILLAFEKKEKICIYGDYDVDGVTSVSLLMVTLLKMYDNVIFHIPLRFDGYGLNKKDILKIKEAGCSLMISVDCGITAIEEVNYANEIGLEVIITDHHEPKELLPNAISVVDPKRKDSTYPFSELAGVGVAYKLATAINSRLKKPVFSKHLLEVMDIVAFGSIADIVPLVDENRILVKFGLELLNDKKNVRRGFKELIEVSGFTDKEITAGHVGYYLAPRINALGRLQDVSEAVQMFLSETDKEAYKIAVKLDNENQKRQSIEKTMIEEALERLPEPEKLEDKVILLGDKNWHTGVKGIVASKILDKYYKPIILCSIDEDNIAHGSARSISGMDIFKALKTCEDLLRSFGGHSMAAGLSFDMANFEAIKDRLNKFATENLSADDYIPKIKYDDIISFDKVSIKLVKDLDLLKPYGQSNPSPTFTIKNARIINVRTMGKEQNHLKLSLFQGGKNFDVVMFNEGYRFNEFEEIRNNAIENCVDVVGQLEINEFRGNQSIQVMGKDLKQSIENVSPELQNLEKLFLNINNPNIFDLKNEKFITTNNVLINLYSLMEQPDKQAIFVFKNKNILKTMVQPFLNKVQSRNNLITTLEDAKKLKNIPDNKYCFDLKKEMDSFTNIEFNLILNKPNKIVEVFPYNFDEHLKEELETNQSKILYVNTFQEVLELSTKIKNKLLLDIGFISEYSTNEEINYMLNLLSTNKIKGIVSNIPIDKPNPVVLVELPNNEYDYTLKTKNSSEIIYFKSKLSIKRQKLKLLSDYPNKDLLTLIYKVLSKKTILNKSTIIPFLKENIKKYDITTETVISCIQIFQEIGILNSLFSETDIILTWKLNDTKKDIASSKIYKDNLSSIDSFKKVLELVV